MSGKGPPGRRSPQSEAGGDLSRNSPKRRRPVLAVVGSSVAPDEVLLVAEAVGEGAVDAGFRLLTGGQGGVMEAASRGARKSAKYREGDVVGIVPESDAGSANPYCDVVIPSGMGHARNVLVVASANVIVAVGGCAGTLSEMALGWQLGKPIVGLKLPGWSGVLADQQVDARRRDVVRPAESAEQAVEIALSLVAEN